MYRILTHQEVANLDQEILRHNKVVITHVGDGEYQFNIFGSAFTSLLVGLTLMPPPNLGYKNVIVVSDSWYDSSSSPTENLDIDNNYLFYAHIGENSMSLDARITIDEVDSYFYLNEGYHYILED